MKTEAEARADRAVAFLVRKAPGFAVLRRWRELDEAIEEAARAVCDVREEKAARMREARLAGERRRRALADMRVARAREWSAATD